VLNKIGIGLYKIHVGLQQYK